MRVVVHTSLSAAAVEHIARIVGECQDGTPAWAAGELARRWAEYALTARRQGLSTWLMWDEMAAMALAVARKG